MTTPLSPRAANQIQASALRIPDVRERDRFTAMMLRAAELAQQSKHLRVSAWARYRTLTGLEKGTRSVGVLATGPTTREGVA
jgi:hypothetical protein